MFIDILDKNQKEMLNLLKSFKRNFYLVGGTALALQIGHRESIDFDLFSNKPIRKNIIIKNLNLKKIQKTIVDTDDNFSLLYNNVNLTFFHYPFEIEANINLGGFFRAPDILTIAAMKAYALGRRSKWKDYVDLYFILKQHSFSSIVEKSKEIFGGLFSEKLFREQLCYFEDINFSQKVNFVVPAVSNDEIMNSLIRIATTL